MASAQIPDDPLMFDPLLSSPSGPHWFATTGLSDDIYKRWVGHNMSTFRHPSFSDFQQSRRDDASHPTFIASL